MGRARRSWDRLRHLSRRNALSICFWDMRFVWMYAAQGVFEARWVSGCILEHRGVFWKLTGGELPRHRLGVDGSYVLRGKGLS